MPYPMPLWMMDPVKAMILKDNYNIVYKTPTDNSNDASGQVSTQQMGGGK
jgi:hypothetical protein